MLSLYDAVYHVHCMLHHSYTCTCYMSILKGWGSVVSIVTRYRLDGQGFEPWGGGEAIKVDLSDLIAGQLRQATALFW